MNEPKDKRLRITQIIEQEGPADVKHLHDKLGGSESALRQLVKRMVKDGWLASFPLAPRTYYTPSPKILQNGRK